MNDIPNAPDPAIEALEDELDSVYARLADYENVGGESLPGDVVWRMSDGEHPIRVFREYRGLSIEQLAEAAKTTPVEIANMEAGERVDLTILKHVARALKVDADDLIPWSQD